MGVIIPDIYANAGGVTVSYFEVQNLHMQFGLMEKRIASVPAADDYWHRSRHRSRLPAPIRDEMLHGVDELALVNPGLEESMVESFQILSRSCTTTDA